MKRVVTAVLAAACCLTFLAFAPTPKPTGKPGLKETQYALVFVMNKSDHSAWVDVSSSYKVQAGWDIEKAFCLNPGQYENVRVAFSYSLGPQVRVRAEIKPGKENCGGGNIANPQTQMDVDFPWRAGSVSLTSLVEGSGSYSVTIKKEARR